MDWADMLLKKSSDRTLTQKDVLHSLFHMVEINENALDDIQTDKSDFGPELEEFKQTKISELNFHLKYYRGLINYVNSITESKIVKNYHQRP